MPNPNRPFVADHSFDPESVHCMSAALYGVCSDLGLSVKAEYARDVVAKRIIELAIRGERDPLKLRAAVLASLERPSGTAANERTLGRAVRSKFNAALHHKNRALARLPQPDLDLLVPFLQVVGLEPGAGHHQELPLAYVYFPVEGMVSRIATAPSGETIEMASMGHDGAICPILQSDPGDRLITLGRMTALRIAVDRLELILRQSEILRRTLGVCREALLVQLRQNLVCAGLHSVDQRLPRWLLQAADRIGSDIIPATKDAVAQRLGLRRTTVTLVAETLRAVGAIRWLHSRVEILNRSRLETATCTCYPALRESMSELLPFDSPAPRNGFRNILPRF